MSSRRPLSVRMTDDLAADLEVLRRSGMTASDAVRHAVRLIANAQRYADRRAAEGGGRSPRSLCIRTPNLYGPPTPYDGPDQHV